MRSAYLGRIGRDLLLGRMEQEKEKLQNKVVETYAEDMARVIEGDQGGLIKKIIQEQAQKEQEKKNRSPESRKNKLYTFFSFLLLVVSLVVLFVFISKEDIYTVPVEKQFTPIIFHDRSFFIEISDLPKDKIVSSVLTEKLATTLKPGGVEGIYLTLNKQIIGLRDFLKVTNSSWVLPEVNLVDDSFLLGLVNRDDKDLFILVKMRSFTDIFESVRSWEEKMLYDLHTFFEVPINSNTSYLFTKEFEDEIVENKNARILYDEDDAPVLMYVFADDTSLIFADSVSTVREVILRLASSQIKK